MLLLTFDEILTNLCDYFDSLIRPKKITRSNTNIVYLILKSVSKGYELINNVCVTLHNKFDPANCEDTDLNSVASLVGTEKRLGAQSGLKVTAYNSNVNAKVLPAGTYTYRFNEDLSFFCELTEAVSVTGHGSYDMIFLTPTLGSFPVTTQTSINVTADVTVPPEFRFSCLDNDNLLGYETESNLAFRKRILTDTTRQDVVTELREAIRNLPYVYECEVIHNPDVTPLAVGSYVIPPFHLLILMSTALYKEEIASVVAEKSIFPTLNVEGTSHEIRYNSDVFVGGYYPVYINDFDYSEFNLRVTYKVDTDYVDRGASEDKMRQALLTQVNSNVHTDEITTEDVMKILSDLNLEGVKVLGVEFYVEGIERLYITFNKAEIGKLIEVDFSEV